MRALFIVNPAAGHGRGRERWERVAARVLAAQPDCEARLTSGPQDASRLCRRGLEEGFDAVLAVGGDGTLGEAVDGYLSAPEGLRGRRPLGTWPVGSGCDLARHLGIRGEAEPLLELLARPKIRRLDAGLVEFAGPQGRLRRHFLNVSALGLAGDVALRVHSGGKPWGGTLSYLMSSLAALLTARSKSLDLTVDGVPEPRAPYHLIVMANTSTFGGGMRVAPTADPQDGLLDLVAVGDLSRWGLLRRFPLIYTGGHIGVPGVTHRLVRRLEVRSPEEVYLNIDGEAIGTLPASFEVLPGAVPFLCIT